MKRAKSDSREVFQCNSCGEDWIHGGDPACPFCGSDDTGPKAEPEASHAQDPSR